MIIKGRGKPEIPAYACVNTPSNADAAIYIRLYENDLFYYEEDDDQDNESTPHHDDSLDLYGEDYGGTVGFMAHATMSREQALRLAQNLIDSVIKCNKYYD